VLQAWAILERDVGNIGTVDEEFTARWLFRTADEKDPDNVIIVHPWAMMERKQGNLEASTALLERAARLQGDARDRCRTYYDLGMILHWAGQRERAHGYFALAVDANPRDWRAQAAFARSLGYQRQWGLAEYHFALSLSVKEARRTLEWRDRMRATRLRIVTTKA
jgi:tetratricopeptide (TPR) repeat protein